MAIVDFLVVLAVLATAVWLVSGPLRSPAQAAAREEAQLADLEAAKESKYREIREAELDYRTGKLSEADWKGLDRQLRAEAVDILRRLDAAGAPAPEAPEEPPPASIPDPWTSSSPSSRSSSPSS